MRPRRNGRRPDVTGPFPASGRWRRWARGATAAAWLVLAPLLVAPLLPASAGAQERGGAVDTTSAPVADSLRQPPRGRLEGRVRARPLDGGHPLPHAMIRAEGAAAVLADAAGGYALRGVRPGLVKVVAAHVGYAPAEVEVLVPAGGTVAVDLELTREVVELPGIVVTGGRLRPADPDDRTLPAEAARALVRLRALEASPGLAEAGLGDAVRERGEPSGDPADALFMRGSTADLKLVLLDGAPVYTPFHLGGLLPSFDAAVLGAAEHHVGGAPARYDGGLSYILDLRTRSPRRDRVRTAGSLDLVSARGSLETPLGPGAGLLVATRGLHGLGGRLAGGDGSPYGYADGLARLDADALGGSLSLTGFANRESVHLDLEGADHPPTRALGDGSAEWGNLALAAGWSGSVGTTALEVGASTSRYRAELPVHESSPDTAASPGAWTVLATGRTDRHRLTVDASRPGEAGPLRFGASADRMELRYDATGGPPGGPPRDARGAGSVLGAYVDGVRPVVDGLDLRWGARLDRFVLDAGDVEDASFRGALRVALLWDLGADALLTVAAGRYHQLARRSDADVELAAGEAIQVGTGVVPGSGSRAGPVLSVARADHLVASLDQRIGDAVHLDTELFLKTFTDVAGVGTRSLTSSGVDLRVLRQGTRSTAWLGYSLAWFWEPVAGSGATEFSGRHLLSAGLRSALVGPTGIDARLSFSDGLPLTSIPFVSADRADAGTLPEDDLGASPTLDVGPGAADGFLRVDVELFAEWEWAAGGREGRIRPYLKVLNALDRRDALFYYFEPWRSEGLRPLAELSLVPVVGLEWRF